MKTYLLLASMVLAGTMPMMADIEDDIYYNPKNEAHKSNQTYESPKAQSNYIANFQDMDVDVYNSRGQYYSSPVDTIGAGVENAPDFVYTTEIQKFYNPTIVVDNEEILADVLENSYGNVTVEYNINGIPTFCGWSNPWFWNAGWVGPYYGYPYYGYYGWGSPWYDPWYWGPSYAWGWGPGWGISWGPVWGPGWGGWGPSWGGWHRPPHYTASYRPNGMRPVGGGAGWSHNTRPGNYAGNIGSRPGSTRPAGTPSAGTRPSTGYGRQPGQGAYTSNGSTGTRYNGNSATPSRGGYTVGSDGHRYTGSGTTGGSTVRNSGNTTRNSGSGAYRSNSGSTTRNSGTSTRNNSNSNSTRSYNSGGSTTRSSGSYSGGSYSGGSRSYGGGSRSSGGGGGSRGGRR